MPLLVLPLITLVMISSWELTIICLPLLTAISSLFIFNPMSTTTFHSPLITTDPLSIAMIMLTLWISVLMFTSSMKIKIFALQSNFFCRITLSLTLVLTMAFSVNNLISYYIFFEASLIPTLTLILVWGYQPERLQAGMYFMLYTITASLPLLMGIFMLLDINSSVMFFSPMISQQTNHPLNLMLVSAFLVKMPMYPFHLWLPKAHVEAPVAGSMILAGVLLKLGAYGIMRMAIFSPLTLKTGNTLITSLSLVGSIISSFICLRQHDLKSLIAYASVSHMGIMTASIYSFSSWGWKGAVIMMIAHGLASSALFSLANMSYESTNTRSIMLTKGALFSSPSMALWWFLLIAANMAAPPSLNFMAEILILSSITCMSHMYIFSLMTITFLSVAYSLILYSAMHHGPPSKHSNFNKSVMLNFTTCFLHTAPLILLLPAAPLFTL